MSHQEESNKFIEEARLLLPWYLTNTLSDEEQDLVNQALEASPELRKEFVREEKMMRLVRENTSLLELSALDTTEQRLENTFARIDREELQQVKLAEISQESAVRQPQRTSATGTSWFKRLFGEKLFESSWLTPANAVFASLLVVQVGVLGYYQLNNEGAKYITANIVKESPAGNDLKQLFLMEFEADANYGAVCDFLNDWEANVVSGPNSRNVFVVEMKTKPHTDVGALAASMMDQAEKNNAPIVFVGPQFSD